ncbi:MAG: S-adenosylmethionine decarboxylase [Microscillaceae bacterium]|nr:S-adenosylmethionine decarboxylase [Microscillaceae bacterium]MDW8461679.1 S-adenosylmethionine decarboxylase [Cytophagales bacterium]
MKAQKAQIYNYRTWLLETNSQWLFEYFQNLLREVGFTIIQHVEHHFQPQGYTCIWLLAESHLALHTFPEANKTYLELSSCDEEKYHHFCQKLVTPIQQVC